MRTMQLLAAPVLLLLAAPLASQRTQASGAPSSGTNATLERRPGEVVRQAPLALDLLPISASDQFGHALVALGDLDGNGWRDLAVGAPWEETDRRSGTLWILFLGPDGVVERWRHVDPIRPPESGTTFTWDHFGSALAYLGDLDGDGLPELAVGAPADESNPAFGNGKVWIVSLASDGAAIIRHAITEGQAGFGDDLVYSDGFGAALEAVGDLDGDGLSELAVGAPRDDVAGVRTGSARILFLNSDATVRAVTTLAAGVGGFTGALDALDGFGSSIAGLGDLDGDGTADIAVGAPGDDDTITPNGGKGAMWVLFLDPDGTVRAHQKLSELEGNLGSVTNGGSDFGAAADVFDLTGDGTPELLVGAPRDQGNQETGGVWMLSLASDGTVLSNQSFTQLTGGVSDLRASDRFGTSVAALGDLDGNGTEDLFVGAPLRASTLCRQPGVLFRFLLAPTGLVADQHEEGGKCLGDEGFGMSAVELGDLDGDGQTELVVGAPGTFLNMQGGSVWLFERDGESYTPWVNLWPATTGGIIPLNFGVSVAALGDINADGEPDLAVGSEGRVYVLRLNPNGTIKGQKSFLSGLSTVAFGRSMAAVGDLDGNGVRDLVVGAPGTNSAGAETGALSVVYLAPDGSRLSGTLIGRFTGGFTGFITTYDRFGQSLAALGDLDGDGLEEVAVGAPGDAIFRPGWPGSVWILSLTSVGTVARELQITYGLAGMTGPVGPGDNFGSGLTSAGDLDGDGLPELLVAASGDDTSGSDHGALWLLFLRSDGTVRAWRRITDGAGIGVNVRSGSDWGRGMALLPSQSGNGRQRLFLGAPSDDRFHRNAGWSWLVDLSSF